MKNLVARILSVGIALTAAVAVHAQDKNLNANVPFGFYVGSTPMPQGAYRIDGIGNSGVFALLTKDAAKTMTTITVSGKSQDEPARLVFHRYGNDYFLAQIWSGGGSTGRALIRSQREKELAQTHTATLAVIRIALPR